MADTLPAERVRGLQAAGPGADDHDRIRPGRERTRWLGHAPHRFAVRSRRACAWSIRNMTLGWLIMNGST